jgi:hypothetical protein
MYATFDTHTTDQPAEAFVLRRLGDGRTSALALWATTTDPAAYHVDDDLAGSAAGQPASAATVIWFDGPISPARRAAGRFGFRERIAPAMAGTPGHVRTLVLWREQDAAGCVVVLATDLDALDAVGRAVNSTQLLPGEDPALLTGPDRFEVHHVLEGVRS